VSERGEAPSFLIYSPSPLKERGTEVEDSSRGEVDKYPLFLLTGLAQVLYWAQQSGIRRIVR